MHAAIVGAGVAGLAAAIALARVGIRSTVFERAPLLTDIGAGIQLPPNAMKALSHLGLAEALAPRLAYADGLTARDGRDGRILVFHRFGDAFERRYGAGYATVHRADLVEALQRVAGTHAGITLTMGETVGGVETTAVGTRLDIGGRAFEADFVIAADGVLSNVRRNHFGLAAGTPTGATAFRATLPGAAVAAPLLEGAGPQVFFLSGAHFVLYPLRGGDVVNVVLVEHSGRRDPKAMLTNAWPPLRTLGRATSWIEWPLAVNNAGAAWVKGRVVLIGDAAHAMLPSAAQGGAMALEDACVLAACLEDGADPITGLHAFQSRRRSRTRAIARMAERNLMLYGLDGASRHARNFAMRLAGEMIVARRLDPLFAWSPV